MAEAEAAAWLNAEGFGSEVARAGAFTALVTGHLSLAFAESVTAGAGLFVSTRRVFWFIALGATILLIAALSVPFLLEVLRFQTPSPMILIVSVLVGLVSGGWYAAVLTVQMSPARFLASEA